jgi:GMP synthase-like glutamine amidotransferase
MAIIVFQHEQAVGPGRLGAALRDHAQGLDIRRLDLDWRGRGGHGLPAGTGVAGRGGVPPDFDNVDGVISLGGGQNVGEGHPWMEAEIEFLREAHQRQLPLVGVCLGHQLIAHALGGKVGPAEKPEWGFTKVHQHPVANTDVILAGIAWTTWQFQAHNQEVKEPPPGATVLQYSERCKAQSLRMGLRTYTFQYHFAFDRAMLEAVAKDSTASMQAAGTDAAAITKQTDEHYEEFARLADRLCGNLAAFLFPVGRG